MRIRCPQCHSPLNIVDAVDTNAEASCPSCGSHFPVADLTISYRITVSDRIAHFDLLNKVGAGQFGNVWRARDTKLNRIVAVKIPRSEDLDENHKAMFLREARAAAALDHPNVVHVYEVGEDQQSIYIASQFIEGVTLRDRLALNPYQPRAAAEFLATVCQAVHHAHEAGVVHRDLKPSNILVDTDGQPHVSDFGLAKLDNAEVTVTVSGQILGTPAYMSPEQARGDSLNSDRRSDVYSLGVVLYEMLTGKRPFDGSSALLLHQIQSRDPRSPRALKREIPRDLETICLKALSKSPDRRYATAQDMADDLLRFCRGEPIRARRMGTIERTAKVVRRNLTSSALLLIALSSSAAALTLGMSRPSASAVQKTPIRLETEPAGAQVCFFKISDATGEPDPDQRFEAPGKTPFEMELPPGDYLVVAKLSDRRFHEVYRYVPSDPVRQMPEGNYMHRSWTSKNGRAVLTPIKIQEFPVADDMALFSGSETFSIGIADSALIPVHERAVRPFRLDSREVTYEEFVAATGGKPAATLKRKDLPPDNYPVTGLFFDEAIKYAELVGKRLPTEWEYEFAATMGGTQRYPWGDQDTALNQWTYQPAGEPTDDRTQTQPPVFGLFSNVPEFTDSPFTPYPASELKDVPLSAHGDGRSVTIRGGTEHEWQFDQRDHDGPRMRGGESRKVVSLAIGFRCARSERPRWLAEDILTFPTKPSQ